MLSVVPDVAAVGPLLKQVLGAQRAAERIVGDRVALRRGAELIMERWHDLGAPILWPVGEAAERLAGAVVLAGASEIRLRGWTDDVRGQPVLLFAVADVATLALQNAARHARHLGATEVHACAVDLADSPGLGGNAAFDSYCCLGIESSGSTPPALVIRQ